MTSWTLTDADHAMIAREIEPFLPDRIFDAHAHLFTHEHFAPHPVPASYQGVPERIDLATYYQYIDWLHPKGRTKGGLFFGLAFTGDRDANNDFVAAEVSGSHGKNAFGQMIISPDMTAETVSDTVQNMGFSGLKCYHTMVLDSDEPTWHAPIEAYLTEAHIQVANELGLTITLHMVRDRALADPINQATIRRYCESYPNMRLILAHAARGFNPWHTIEGIESLRGIDNVWFDTSAVTEAGAFEAIIETMGHERLMYGTDFHVSHMRGRCVAIGDSFHWFYADDMNTEEKHIQLEPVLIGLESIRSLRLACRRLKLTDNQIEDIFYNNAKQLFALED
jgi:predicted TIM-barrel fold metal-dependent hydrolase